MGMAPDARRYAQAIVDALELPSASTMAWA